MPRLVYDRPTWLSYLQLGAWGFFLYGFGPVVPLLRDEQGTSAAVAGLHSTGIAVGALLGGLVSPGLTRRLGRDRVVWAGLTGVGLGVVLLCLLRPLPATLGATVVVATCGIILINAVVATLAERHGPAAPAAISEANAVCAGMGILAPLALGAAVGAGFGGRPALAIEVGLLALVALGAALSRGRPPARPDTPALPAPAVAVPVSGPEPEPPSTLPTVPTLPSATGGQAANRRMPRPYWIAWLLLSVTGSIEVCLSLWAADVLRSHAGMSAGDASAALAAIVAGMFVGRVAGGRLALRFRPVPLLLVAFGVSLLGFTVFWAAPVGWLAVCGLVILGLGNAMHYPLGISLAIAVSDSQPDRAAGYASYSMTIGFGLGPVLLGRIADEVGPHLAFLLLPVFIGLAVLLTLRLRPATTGPVGATRLAMSTGKG